MYAAAANSSVAVAVTPQQGPCSRCQRVGVVHKCSLCRSVSYCSVTCQKKDWELVHKIKCKEVRAQREKDNVAALTNAAHPPKAAAEASSSAAGAPAPVASPPLETDLSSDAPIVLPLPSRWLYPPSSLPALFSSPAPLPDTPVGLRNPARANSCFINASLQALCATAPLANFLQSLAHAPGSCVVKSSGKHCTLCAIEAHRLLVLQRTEEAGPRYLAKPILPVEILKNLNALNSDYHLGQQEDSQEATKALLQSLDEAWLKNAQAASAAEAATAAAAGTPPASAQSQRLSQRTLETTPISQLFGGYLLSQLKCANPLCEKTTNNFERFLDLSLEIIEATDNLPEMLEAFSRVERLDAKNLYKCSHCSKATRARKQITIWQQPNILMVQLKRFRYGTFGKVNKYIHFPMQLSLEEYMTAQQRETEAAAAAAAAASASASSAPAPASAPVAESDDAAVAAASSMDAVNASSPAAAVTSSSASFGSSLSTPYRLYAVIVHLDLMAISSFGHYISYIRSPQSDDPEEDYWYRLDDDEIKQVSTKEVMMQKAYILFYQRTKPFVANDEVEPEPTPEQVAAAAAAAATAAAAAASSADPSSSSDPSAAAAPAKAASSEPVQCVGGCGFWGKSDQENMCSLCFRKAREARGEIVAAPPKPAASSSAGAHGEDISARVMAARMMQMRAQQAQQQEAAMAAMAARFGLANGAAGGSGGGGGFYEQFQRQQLAAAAASKPASKPAAKPAASSSTAAAAASSSPAEQEQIDALALRLATAKLQDVARQEQAAAEAAAAATAAVVNPAAEGATGIANKQCSSCHEFLFASAYSSAQIKKQGKRVCSKCVSKREAKVTAK